MIAPSDPDYAETKLVKRGERVLTPLFKELADWIAAVYPGVVVLNIYYDKVARPANLAHPRLNVIFEWEDEKKLFCVDYGSFDPLKADAIAAKFKELLRDHPEQSFDTNRLFVIFSAFEPVARLEAIWRVRPEQLAQLQSKMNNPAIWQIRGDWGGIGVFFYTNAQLKNLQDGLKAECADAYAEIISEYDEFGYFQRKPAQVTFESKENFDKNYHGNWFYYDRR
jgi:hypothetical protein